jgi:hypothetical protein
MAPTISRPTLIPRELQDGSEWYVLVTWPDGRSEHVGEFASEPDAKIWIITKSAAWIRRAEDSRRG